MSGRQTRVDELAGSELAVEVVAPGGGGLRMPSWEETDCLLSDCRLTAHQVSSLGLFRFHGGITTSRPMPSLFAT